MTIALADAFARIQAGPPAPVLLIDTCCFLDLFRTDESQTKVPYQPRAPHQEIRDAADLLALVNATPEAAHLIVPELVPREYSDHAAAIQAQFGKWTELHDKNQDWLLEASLSVALALPAPHPVHPYGLAALLRGLANDLLAKAWVLERDQACVDRALHRLINKVRPSHRKEVKDSMNLEQCLELSSAAVVYRVVNVEGFIAYQQNFYSVPWRYIDQALPVRIGATELIVYGPQIEEVARHRLLPRDVAGQRCEQKAHRPSSDPRQHEALLRERFTELGPSAVSFREGLLQQQRQGKSQAGKVLALLGSYARSDLLAALERAVRFGAYSLNAVERILAVQAQPKSILETLTEQQERQLPSWLRDNPVVQRPTADYLHLVEGTNAHDTSQQPQADAGDAGHTPSAADGPAGTHPG